MKKILFMLITILICSGCSYKYRESKPRHINQYYKECKTGYQYDILTSPRSRMDATQRRHIKKRDCDNRRHKRMIKKQRNINQRNY